MLINVKRQSACQQFSSSSVLSNVFHEEMEGVRAVHEVYAPVHVHMVNVFLLVSK